jgi:hypothetical protein
MVEDSKITAFWNGVPRWLLSRLEGASFDDIRIRDLRRGVTPSFFPVILSALLLLRETDPRRYRRIRRFLPWIVNFANSLAGSYHHKIGCFVHFEEPASEWQRPYTVAGYATTLVHEATHGVIRTFGIRYKVAVRSRIERLCWTEEQRFIGVVTRVRPDLAKYFEHLRREFDESRWHEVWNRTRWQRAVLEFRLMRADRKEAAAARKARRKLKKGA